MIPQIIIDTFPWLKKQPDIVFGTTFSTKYCGELGLDWKGTYIRMLSDFKFKTVRLCAYWDQLEPNQGEFEFEWLEWLLKKSKDAGVDVTLSIGRKVPRWPEYHEPKWALSQDSEFLNEALLNYIKVVLEQFGDHPSINRIQIENEPFFSFGKSNFPITKEIVEKEVQLVRKLTNKNIIITDSGEHSDWISASLLADIVGINIYRTTFDRAKGKYSYNYYLPRFYRNKAKRISKPILAAELQAEPWGPRHNPKNFKPGEWKKSISPRRLRHNVRLASAAGISEIWLWGCEWWYYLDLIEHDARMVKAAKGIVNV